MKRTSEPGALEMIEEATHLLRQASAGAWLAYYAGTLPFVLGTLYFWSDMSRSAFAATRLPEAALGVGVLFLWMKAWQSVFSGQLLSGLSGETTPRGGLGWLVRVAVGQAVLQPTGLFVLPVAFALTAPFPWVYAFYQNVTVFGGNPDEEWTGLARKAWRQARLWTAQNFGLLLVIQLFGFIVLLNVSVAVVAAPLLMDRLLGVPTVFTQSKWALLNSTFFATVLGLTYLCLDPLLKAVYVLRCFYGESLQTGADLKAQLRRFAPGSGVAGMLVAVLAALGGMPSASAAPVRLEDAPSRLAPADLNRSIDRVLSDREFQWRLPREAAPKEEREAGMLAGLWEGVKDALVTAVKTVGRWIEDLINWLKRWLSPRFSPRRTPGDWTEPIRVLVVVLIAGLLCLLVWLALRMWRRWREQTDAETQAQPIGPAPDLADESVGAEQLPQGEWLRLARELWERGELRLALRAFYLSSLADLSGRGLLSLARFKSNLDYARELGRRAHAVPGLAELFLQVVGVFDGAWYGRHEVTAERLGRFAAEVEQMRACQT